MKFNESLRKLRGVLENSRPSLSHRNLNDFMHLEMAFNEVSRVFRELREKQVNWSWNRLCEYARLKAKERDLRELIIMQNRETIRKMKIFFYWKFEFLKKRNQQEKTVHFLKIWLKNNRKKLIFYGFQKIFHGNIRKKLILEGISRIKSIFRRKAHEKMRRAYHRWKGILNYSQANKITIEKNNEFLKAFNKIYGFMIKKHAFYRNLAWKKIVMHMIFEKDRERTKSLAIGKLWKTIFSYQKNMKLKVFHEILMNPLLNYKSKLIKHRLILLKKILKKRENLCKKDIFIKFLVLLGKTRGIEAFLMILTNHQKTDKKLVFQELKHYEKPKIAIIYSEHEDFSKTVKPKSKTYIIAGYTLLIILSRIEQSKHFLYQSTFFDGLKRRNLYFKDKNREKSQKIILGFIQISTFFKKTKETINKKNQFQAFKKLISYEKMLKIKENRVIRIEKLGFALKRVFILNKKLVISDFFHKIRLFIMKPNIFYNNQQIHQKELPQHNIQNQYKSPIKIINYESESVKNSVISDVFAEKLSQIKKKFALNGGLAYDKENSVDNSLKKSNKNNDIGGIFERAIPLALKELNPYFLKDDPLKKKEIIP